MWTPSPPRQEPSCQSAGSVSPETGRRTRQDEPSRVAGTTPCADVFRRTISIGAVKLCTSVPVFAHRAVTSTTEVAPPVPATGWIRKTSQSSPLPHAAAGTITRAEPSGEVRDVAAVGEQFISTYGITGGEPERTVKWIANLAVLPAVSSSSPESECGPSANGPATEKEAPEGVIEIEAPSSF